MTDDLPSLIVPRLLFDYGSLSQDEMRALASRLPRKLIRWIGIHHPDNRSRTLFFELTNVTVGEGTVLNEGLTIYDEYEPRVTFGKRVAVATNVTIIASSNPNNSHLAKLQYVRDHLIQLDLVSIGDDAWIGAGATILPGVRIGEGAVIGAGAVVTADVEPYSVVAGIPARVIRRLRGSSGFVCTVCGHREALEVISFPSYPTFLVPLPPELAPNVVRSPLTLAACRSCGHFQLPEVDPEVQRLLYEVYYKHYEVDTLETMGPPYREPFNRLVRELAADGSLPKGRLLEIGCSSGAMIPFLGQFCTSYTAIDPNERIEIARERFPEHTFIRSYFPSEALTERFDVAVTQFNLDHIEKAGEFVEALSGLIVEGGVVLVQVLDIGYFLRTSQPTFVSHEHVHYFRRPQLTQLFASRGFEIERWGEEGPSIICAARRVAQPVTPAHDENPLADVQVFRALAERMPDIPPRPVLYGVGLPLHWLLANDPSIASGASVVDDNAGYHGMGVPGYDLIVQAPTRDLLEGRDVVLTLSAIYHERVVERLRAIGAAIRVHRIASGGWMSQEL
jgi:acetyltransferase-like isoleucine patch superfamily enzyme/2-polyprenyl-3-methyl-5-hydroxy-6-metoxy-1,4-benzoquinol methylase